MDPDAGFDARLEADGVRVTARDAALLRAIDEHGSLNAAADALGRSYSRAQRRVVELEDAFGRLVDRRRGGAGGGGSTLTETADRLLAELDRLETAFAGVADVADTVLPGTVVERDGELGTVETAAGPVRAIVPRDAEAVDVTVRADAITLHPVGGVPASQTSARNQFRGTVTDVTEGDALARLALNVDADASLAVLVTLASVERLGLEADVDVVASFKATATRATPRPA